MADASFDTVLLPKGEEIVPGYSAVKITIKDLNNETLTLEVEPNCSIHKIKHLINDKKNISVEQQTIIFNGNELQNELDLSYYDIKNDSILHLVDRQIDEKTNDSNPTDDLEQDINTTETPSDSLAQLLRSYGLYEVLYTNLINNQIDLESLEHCLPENEINAFCDEFKLNTTQKMKFRKLMRKIYKQQNPDSKMVIILIGDINVGKTCLVSRYKESTFPTNNTSTIGVAAETIVETLGDNSTMRIIIWDTTGQERYHSICNSYYRHADCVIMCYDASEEAPFKNCEGWRTNVENYCNDDISGMILVGCKIDDIKDKQLHQLNVAKAESIIEQPKWQKFNTIHYECSAKTGKNVRNIFLSAAELVLMNRPRTDSVGESDVVNIDELVQKGHVSIFC